jgi:hypothetical protein
VRETHGRDTVKREDVTKDSLRKGRKLSSQGRKIRKEKLSEDVETLFFLCSPKI